MQIFSPAQCVGYVAFVLGVTAFLQRSDRRLKGLNAAECVAYGVHFFLLGNPSAAASALVSAARNGLSLRFRSPLLAALIVCVNVLLGTLFARSGAGWLPVIASCAATVAVFTLSGIPMRLVFLGCTLLWLANNILSRSIGGTLLEAAIAVVSISTIVRLAVSPERVPAAPGA